MRSARKSLAPAAITRPRRGLRHAAPGWRRYCGWCNQVWPVATDGRNLLCSHCGR